MTRKRTVVFGLVAMLFISMIVMLGLIDGPIGLRRRFSGRTGPPTLTT